MIVTDDAFDELLERAQLIEESGRSADDPRDEERDRELGAEEADSLRREFAHAVDRAVRNVVTRRDGRVSHTQTLKRFDCRLHFVRSDGRIHLIACLALDDYDEDYST